MQNKFFSKCFSSGMTALLIASNFSPVLASTKTARYQQAENRVKTAQKKYNNGAVTFLNSQVGSSKHKVESRVSQANKLYKIKSKKSSVKKFKTYYKYYLSHRYKTAPTYNFVSGGEQITQKLDIKSSITFKTLKKQAQILDSTNAARKKYGANAKQKKAIKLCPDLMTSALMPAALYQSSIDKNDTHDHWFFEAQYSSKKARKISDFCLETISENLSCGRDDANVGWVNEERDDYLKYKKYKGKNKKKANYYKNAAGHYINVMSAFGGNGAVGFGFVSYSTAGRYTTVKAMKKSSKKAKFYTSSQWLAKVNSYENKLKAELNNAKSNLEKVKIEEAKKLVVDLSTEAYIYNGKDKSPGITVYNGIGEKLTKNKDYVIGAEAPSESISGEDNKSNNDAESTDNTQTNMEPTENTSGNDAESAENKSENLIREDNNAESGENKNAELAEDPNENSKDSEDNNQDKVEKITIKTGSATKPYDGTPLTCNTYTITEGAVKDGDILTIETIGTITDVGCVKNTATCKIMRDDTDVTDKYDITLECGDLTVTANESEKQSSEVKYTGKWVGSYKVTVTGIGDYAGQKATATFKIVPPSMKKPSVKAGKKSITVKYSNPDGNSWNYQIAIKKKGKKWKYYKTSKFSKKFKKLSKKKKYYVKVRAYKNTNNGTYYGGWSKTISKKTK